MNDKDPLLLDHDADGIRELDNKLPRWWIWLFYITIIFSAVYLLYYHVFGMGDLQIAEYNKEMKAGEAVKTAAMTKFEASIPTMQPSADEVTIASGKQIYTKACAPCHRADGGGLVGPNLTDSYWIHGSNFTDTVTVIWNGVPAKGMITWKNTLKPDEIYSVASYIYTLRGAKLLTPGKPPENQAPATPAGPSDFE
ncbi:MAG TPA: cbb3-type cytochrome c oxidase N-terminal domain-containing protein [Verrucomicrobiae bacterium]|nr:cbb3-type cytochrome c oxidase N-terminal domain-containing protein [Verrucomicrobiae bacterium]